MTLSLTYITAVFSLNFLFYLVLNPVFNFDPAYQLYSSSFISFIFHGAIIALQNRLYEDWTGSNLFIKIIALLFSGSLVGYLTNYMLYDNPEIGQIVAISTMFTTFFTGLINLGIYHAIRGKSLKMSIIVSGIASAIVDPYLFYVSAHNFDKEWFGGMQTIPAIAIGTILWSFLLIRERHYVQAPSSVN